jgi:hypothetical protein
VEVIDVDGLSQADYYNETESEGSIMIARDSSIKHHDTMEDVHSEEGSVIAFY